MTHNEQSEVKLEPCPWCGAAPDVFEDSEIQCSNKKCDMRPSARWGGAKVWNSRASVVAPQGDARLVDREAAAGVAFDAVMATQGRCYSLTQIAAIVAANVRKIAASVTAPVGTGEHPIDMVLFCPRCGTQHVDAPESDGHYRARLSNAMTAELSPQWTNPPHKSHLCHNCYAVWRPADVPTNGVAQIRTRGKEDNTWTNSAAVPATSTTPVDGEQDDGVTFGRVKVDIENETETFERVYPPATTPPAVTEAGEQEPILEAIAIQAADYLCSVATTEAQQIAFALKARVASPRATAPPSTSEAGEQEQKKMRPTIKTQSMPCQLATDIAYRYFQQPFDGDPDTLARIADEAIRASAERGDYLCASW